MILKHKSYDDIPISDLSRIFCYDGVSGRLYWKKNNGGRNPYAGKVAGCHSNKDGVVVRINGKIYCIHRVIWAISYSEWPRYDIDHIDGNAHNNRITNLRLAAPSQNQRNRPRQSNNKSGYKGVFFNKQKKKWQAKICINYEHHHLGFFDDPEIAYETYCEAAKKYHGEFARTA